MARCERCRRITKRRVEYVHGKPYGPTCAARLRGGVKRVKAKKSENQLELDFEQEYQEDIEPEHWRVIDLIQKQYKQHKAFKDDNSTKG